MQDSTEVIMEETMEYVVDTAAVTADYAASTSVGNPPMDGLLAMLGPMLYVLAGVYLILIVLAVVSNWIIFEKAGRKGWESLIPIYGAYVFFQIIGRSFWNILWAFLPIVGWIILTVRICGSFAKSFGRSVGFAWGLAFFGIIFVAIIAFDKSIVYVGPNGANAPAAELEDQD